MISKGKSVLGFIKDFSPSQGCRLPIGVEVGMIGRYKDFSIDIYWQLLDTGELEKLENIFWGTGIILENYRGLKLPKRETETYIDPLQIPT